MSTDLVHQGSNGPEKKSVEDFWYRPQNSLLMLIKEGPGQLIYLEGLPLDGRFPTPFTSILRHWVRY